MRKRNNFLFILLLVGALVCFFISAFLAYKMVAQPTSLFAESFRSAGGGSELFGYLSILSFIAGLGILVFLKKFPP